MIAGHAKYGQPDAPALSEAEAAAESVAIDLSPRQGFLNSPFVPWLPMGCILAPLRGSQSHSSAIVTV